jgi:hypothetical protein
MPSADGIVIGRHASPLLVAVSGTEVVETFGGVGAGAAGGTCVAVVGFGAGAGFGAVVDVVVVAGVVAAALMGLAPVVVPADAVVGVDAAVVVLSAADALGDASLAVLLEPQPLSTKTKHAI